MRKENVFTEIKGKAEKWDFSTVAAKLIPVKIVNKSVDDVTITFSLFFPVKPRKEAPFVIAHFRSGCFICIAFIYIYIYFG